MKTINAEFLRRTTNELKLEDQVDVVVTEMEAIPPNSNPFHHDSFHMGSSISRGW